MLFLALFGLILTSVVCFILSKKKSFIPVTRSSLAKIITTCRSIAHSQFDSQLPLVGRRCGSRCAITTADISVGEKDVDGATCTSLVIIGPSTDCQHVAVHGNVITKQVILETIIGQ